MKTDKFFIGGKWVAPAASETIAVVNAATEEVMARVPAGTADDARRAVRAAKDAFEGWAATAPAARGALLARIADGLKARSDEIAKLIAGETGMPLKLSSRIQVGAPVLAWQAYAKYAAELPEAETIGNSLVERVPVGVVACITPWNYPLHQVTGKVAAALAAGCTVVLKPSEVAPLSALILAEIVEAAGAPPGIFNVVTGYGSPLGEALVDDEDVAMVSFTGSTATGRRIAGRAAQSVKRVALELGGKSASVILDDADLGMAVKATVASCFLNSGQTCSALTRMLVPSSAYEKAVDIARQCAATYTLGDPLSPDTRLGPLASDLQRSRVRDFIKRGLVEGATLAHGGAEAPEGLDKGFYVKPTVLADVKPDSVVAQEEIFGPVLVVIPFSNDDEAVTIANGVRYGLAGAVWSANEERALGVARRLRTGQVDINGAPFNLAAPFGGFKQSGIGRENGRHGLDEFLELRSLQLPKRT